MDEVGFMITEIEEKGFLRFETLGGIDPAVMVAEPLPSVTRKGVPQALFPVRVFIFKTPRSAKSSPN